MDTTGPRPSENHQNLRPRGNTNSEKNMDTRFSFRQKQKIMTLKCYDKVPVEKVLIEKVLVETEETQRFCAWSNVVLVHQDKTQDFDM